MLKKFSEILSGIPATIVSGIFLLFDLVPHVIELFGGKGAHLHILPFDAVWVTILLSGLPLLYEAASDLVHNQGMAKLSSALLIVIAMAAAISIGDRFAAGEVAWLMAIGEILEAKTAEKAQKGLNELIRLSPREGRRIADGKEEFVPLECIRTGDLFRVLPGETIPVDGTILRGETSVDQSTLTGESLPVDKTPGDAVFSGTINCFGAIDIRATSNGEDGSLQKLIQLVEEAEENPAPTARVVDKVASRLVPLSLLIAILTAVFTRDIIRAVAVLVVFCPCAFALATPTAVMAAIGQATKHGVIIKSGEALETMGNVDWIAFDKTGTLTYGWPEVSAVIPLTEAYSEAALLSLTASAEARSEHPLAKAIVSYAKEKEAAILEPDAFQMTAGKGVCAEIGGKRIICGSERYFEECNIFRNHGANRALERFHHEGNVSILVAEGDTCIGIIALSDTLRTEAAETVSRLSHMHTDVVLLSGDDPKTAAYFASKVGIRQVYGGLLPEEKVERIASLQAAGKTVCMVGDGVNDAPSLKTADVGIAMGCLGSDITRDAADIVLTHDEIRKLPYLKRLSLATIQTIRLSLGLSMAINLIGVVCSVLGLLSPTMGALVHNAGSCFVVLFAALLYDRKLE